MRRGQHGLLATLLPRALAEDARCIASVGTSQGVATAGRARRESQGFAIICPLASEALVA